MTSLSLLIFLVSFSYIFCFVICLVRRCNIWLLVVVVVVSAVEPGFLVLHQHKLSPLCVFFSPFSSSFFFFSFFKRGFNYTTRVTHAVTTAAVAVLFLLLVDDYIRV